SDARLLQGRKLRPHPLSPARHRPRHRDANAVQSPHQADCRGRSAGERGTGLARGQFWKIIAGTPVMQFRLRTLFILTAIVCVYFGVLNAPPFIAIPLYCAIVWLTPAYWIAGVIYAREAR